jgi:hypothetical protein
MSNNTVIQTTTNPEINAAQFQNSPEKGTTIVQETGCYLKNEPTRAKREETPTSDLSLNEVCNKQTRKK